MRTHKRSVTAGDYSVDQLIELGIILCGSPDTVRRRLAESHRTLGFQNFLGLLQFGTLPRDLTERNIRLFAAEVMPALQALTDKDYGGMAKAAAE
jgi:alkanesulfonate monooxygenase SsuD/methylene tetrahydromethanopterin reductase-like flavin-dependent oxidoreductase (luciferase family)